MIGADGQIIGEISVLFLESTRLCVEALQIKLRKEIADLLGADRGMFHPGTLEIPARLVQSVGDTVVLNVAVDELRQMLGHEQAVPAR